MTDKRGKFDVDDTGKLGAKIVSDISEYLPDVFIRDANIKVKVNLDITDEKWFGDDEIRKSQLIIDLDLERAPIDFDLEIRKRSAYIKNLQRALDYYNIPIPKPPRME